MPKDNNYTINSYKEDIDKYGLKKTWHKILSKKLNNELVSNIFKIENFGELYEIGLEYDNIISKKEMGKYYTPKDVAVVMSEWLLPLKGAKVCDVACGTGNLILTYLELLGEYEAYKLISSGNIFLYDNDPIALEICKYSIAIKYGIELLDKINVKKCDFLNKNIKLPKDCKVISNPPYYKITTIGENWNVTKVIEDSKEYYSSFMEKIMKQSSSSVIITPYSFMGSQKFYSLRLEMNNYNGFIVSFDNVPGNIFNGRKHGIFNSNCTNSVRAAITVIENKENIKGFKLSPLIRFKTEERTKLLNCKTLENLVNNDYQLITSKERNYYKCFKDIIDIFFSWKENSNQKLGDLLTNEKNELSICLPTTCRYFTVGAKKDLKRTGKRIIYVKDKEYYDYVYCMMNSTFGYWHWRIYDGGINCPLTILSSIPVFYDKMNIEDKEKIHKIAKKMQQEEEKHLVYKMNAGKPQENIKFPKEYRKEINTIFLRTLNIESNESILNKIHSSSIFKDCEDYNNE